MVVNWETAPGSVPGLGSWDWHWVGEGIGNQSIILPAYVTPHAHSGLIMGKKDAAEARDKRAHGLAWCALQELQEVAGLAIEPCTRPAWIVPSERCGGNRGKKKKKKVED